MKPTLFIDIESRGAGNPVAAALKMVGGLQAELVDQLVDGEVEADVAVTNTLESALRMMKQTERTTIILAHFTLEEQYAATAFASRTAGRVTAVPFVGDIVEDSLVPVLLKMLSDKTKEV